jgi:low temperature requirement protein LtrA
MSRSDEGGARHGLLRQMAARRTDEERASTPLELFFDLCFVVAVAQASGRLHHGLAAGHLAHAAAGYLMVFFAMLAASTAVSAALAVGNRGAALLSLAGAGLVVVFAMWWLYFDRPVHTLLTSRPAAFLWGYGHYCVFAAAAAVGAGLAVTVDRAAGGAHVSARVAGFAVAVPVAGYLLAVWVLHQVPRDRDPTVLAAPVAALLVLAAPVAPVPALPAIAVVLAAVVALKVAGRVG